MNQDDLLVSLPFKELLELLHAYESVNSLEDAIIELQDQVEGLRGIYLQVLDRLKELKA